MKHFTYALLIMSTYSCLDAMHPNVAAQQPSRVHTVSASDPLFILAQETLPSALVSKDYSVLISKNRKKLLKLFLTEESAIYMDERPYPRSCVQEKATFPLNAALACQNISQLKEYYSNWHGGIHVIHEYHQSIADTLRQVAQLPAKELGDLIPFLLKRFNVNYLKSVDCLLDDALTNGHIELVKYIDKELAHDFVELAFFEGIKKNNLTHVTNILKAGISAENGLGKDDIAQIIIHDGIDFAAEESFYAHYPLHHAISLGHAEIVTILLQHKANPQRLSHYKLTPLNTALRSFKEGENEELINRRIAIVQALYQALPEHGRPLPVECNVFFVPPSIRERVLNIARSFAPKAPQRVTMSDEWTLEEIEKLDYKLKIGSALMVAPCALAGICLARYCKSPKKSKDQEKQIKAQPPIITQKAKNSTVHKRK